MRGFKYRRSKYVWLYILCSYWTHEIVWNMEELKFFEFVKFFLCLKVIYDPWKGNRRMEGFQRISSCPAKVVDSYSQIWISTIDERTREHLFSSDCVKNDATFNQKTKISVFFLITLHIHRYTRPDRAYISKKYRNTFIIIFITVLCFYYMIRRRRDVREQKKNNSPKFLIKISIVFFSCSCNIFARTWQKSPF